MACHFIKTKNTRFILCRPNIYKFPYNGQDFYFEWHNYLGPSPVRKRDLGLRKTAPPGFWDAITEFSNLSEDKKRWFLIDD